ncbi:hypothetical protein KEM48_011023 [Puccinia striiformis f. sp. tritici PST-130]|nr:hypothetical protein KEM48_011023 [Puccinia striiformis f. sp. tritici PST-130]
MQSFHSIFAVLVMVYRVSAITIPLSPCPPNRQLACEDPQPQMNQMPAAASCPRIRGWCCPKMRLELHHHPFAGKHRHTF